MSRRHGEDEMAVHNIYGSSDKVKIGPRKLTRFEIARIIGARALQISMGAPPLLDVTSLPRHVREDPVLLAKAEFEAGVLPMTIIRYTRRGDKQIIPIQWLLEETKRAWR